MQILTIGIRQHQGQDEKYRKSPPRQLETALVKGQERHADREDEHDCIPVSRHLGVSAHDLEIGIVVFDIPTRETGDCDLPGTTAVVAQLLWWIRLLVVQFITLPAEFFMFDFLLFQALQKKGHTAKAIVAEILVKPQKKRKIYDGAHCDKHTRSEARIWFFFTHKTSLFFARNTYMRSPTFRKSSLIQLKLRSQDGTAVVGFSRSSVDAGRHGAEFLRVEGVGVVEDRIEDPAGEDDGDALRDTDPKGRYQRF